MKVSVVYTRTERESALRVPEYCCRSDVIITVYMTDECEMFVRTNKTNDPHAVLTALFIIHRRVRYCSLLFVTVRYCSEKF